ncbi:MAG: hypothetical protein GY750_08545 [Lentisphaerae bacterium]|nr:hypothetical protein [Lentisphaerota bacterium]MCP4101458.1 hypothetical protein [Lentisphaerota bacterium]
MPAGLTPREVYEQKVSELQAALQQDDCWLPGMKRSLAKICQNAELHYSSGDPEPLRNGIGRSVERSVSSCVANQTGSSIVWEG